MDPVDASLISAPLRSLVSVAVESQSATWLPLRPRALALRAFVATVRAPSLVEPNWSWAQVAGLRLPASTMPLTQGCVTSAADTYRLRRAVSERVAADGELPQPAVAPSALASPREDLSRSLAKKGRAIAATAPLLSGLGAVSLVRVGSK